MQKYLISISKITALLALTASTALAQGQVIPKPTKHDVFESIEGNAHFVRDRENPRVLLKADGAASRGIDPEYMQMMARPKIAPEAMQALKDAGAPSSIGPMLHSSQLFSGVANLTDVRGNILVIEGDANTVRSTQQGPSFNTQGPGLQTVIQEVFQRLGDNFDFITVMTTFQDPGAAGFYLPLQQTTTGLGECNPNVGATFGCIFNQFQQPTRLQGFVFMNSIDYWRNWDRGFDGVVHPLSSFEANVYAVMGQEIGHRWGAGMRFIDPRTGVISKELLGRDESHWAAYADTDASVHDGWDWEQNSQGSFDLVDDMQRFSTLDLYAMGALPVGAAKPFFFIDNARFVPNQFVSASPIPAQAGLSLGASVQRLADNGIVLQGSGERVDLTVQDVVNAEGSRCPDADSTQKTFKQLIVLVTRPGQSIAQAQGFVDELEEMRTTWEAWWKDRTDNALTLCTDIFDECEHASAELGKGVANNDETIDPGQTFDLEIEVRSTGAAVENARVRFALFSKGAETAEIDLDEPIVDVGDLDAGESKTITVPIALDDDYPCSTSLTVEATLLSDNAQTVTEDYTIFPGTRPIYAFSFDESDDEFTTNDDGLDDASSGAMEYSNISLTCFMSPRTPERDATPGGTGAWITGDDENRLSELNGSTSLWSGKLPLDADVTNPLVRFKFWLDIPEGQEGLMKVLVSTDGEKFTRAKEYTESFHGWAGGFVRVLDVLDEVPEDLYITFVFEGNRVEGGVDDFRLLDDDGTCRVGGPCGCSIASEEQHQEIPYGLAALFILGGALLRRRR